MVRYLTEVVVLCASVHYGIHSVVKVLGLMVICEIDILTLIALVNT